MPTRDTPWPEGTPCWVDLSAPDVPVALEFYGAVLGWTFDDSGEEYGHYHIARRDGRAAAGLGPPMQEGQPSVWTVYLAADDVDATAKRIDEHGGTLLAEPMDVPGNGRMCIAQDPTGAVFGVWQAAGMIGMEIHSEPGSVVWEDVRLGDPEAGRAFYGAVFGHTFSAVEGAPPDYRTFDVAGRPAGGMGGMMGAPDGTPSHWIAYFSVADTDAAVAEAQRRGATVLMPPEDTPFGRIGMITDPFGAVLGLHAGPTG